MEDTEPAITENQPPVESAELEDQEAYQVPISTYIRRKPPAQDCDAEQMITIETVHLRKGGWRNTEGVLSDLRHMDPKIGLIIFFGIMTAVIFYLYWRKYQSIVISSVYTTSSVALLAVSFSAAFGIDFFGAIGAAMMI